MNDAKSLPDTMTAQEVFDWVVGHLRQQGAKCVRTDPQTACVYRNDKGMKCAAGALIRDDEYAPWMDGEDSSPSGFAAAAVLDDSRCPVSLQVRLEPHRLLVGSLQSVHDFDDKDAWESCFKECARRYDLSYTPPEAK